jgi:phenylalanyl-tRNA synthetase alpha chain
MEELKRIEKTALTRAKKARTSQDVAVLRAEILGKKGALGTAMRSLGEVAPEERPKLGAKINEVKTRIEEALDEASTRITASERESALASGRYDVTLPGRRVFPGAPHALRLIEDEVVRALAPLGFTVATGPLVEHDWYNFEALNMPRDHPARDMHDTFFVGSNTVLRTHTSNTQIRTMLTREPPVRVLAPGMVFRKDNLDATHSPVFHQVEGLWIDERATFADLKGVLKTLAIALFGPDAQIRLRPSFFPFTEPSVEVDVRSPMLKKGMGWLEILGAGMVHPAVLEHTGYDPEKVQGFAFGTGIERLAMLKYGIDDIRLLYENDLRFANQFVSRAGA